MGSGKTSWFIDEILNKNTEENILYITPYLSEIERIQSLTTRRIASPENKGKGKLDNLSKLLSNQMDIAATHELFRRFDDKCKNALKENDYTLILDETLTAVEPFHFTKKDDFQYLLNNHDITVADNGLIEWVGSELDTRFDDIRILSKNKCLFKVDDKFFLWHFPHEIFSLFKKVYILTYLFDGSLMKYYFDLYQISYDIKSVMNIDGQYKLVDYYKPNKKICRERIKIYEGKLNTNISQKKNVLSATWSRSPYYKNERKILKNNLFNFQHNIIKANSQNTIWTCYKDCKKELKSKGYTNSFVPCNCRATNDYRDATCLMYCVNWFENPEIVKFFAERGITVNQDKIALSSLLQWIWRSNIRNPNGNEKINIYVPSTRMRNLLIDWLND